MVGRTWLRVALVLLCAEPTVAQKANNLEVGFANPPQSARPLTWWHWINGNVSRDGIRADLEDMRRVGVAGVQTIDVSMYIPQGPARYGSEEWFGDVQYAIQTAHRLGLSFGMANAPGWSGSGGPWVTPELSMQHVVWSETSVDGGRRVQIHLERPPTQLEFYRDIAVVAIPAEAIEDKERSSVEVTPMGLFDRDEPVAASGDDEAAVTFRYAHAVERRTLASGATWRS